MIPSPTKAALSPARKRLVETMQDLNFGTIEGLVVRDGEPVFNTSTRIVRDIKLCGENGPRPEASHPDFVLKEQVVELFQHLKMLGNGCIESLEIKHGLPFRLTIEQPV
jgi:hypothetical protein